MAQVMEAFEGQELAYTGETITSTTKKTNWGVNVWRQWAAKNGETRPLETISFATLNKLLCRFYAEICKVSGEPYEAECLRLMRKSIERYLQENTIGEVSLKRDPTFRESNMVLKQRMRALMLRGNRKQQLVQINISAKEEELLWRSGQLGNQSALALLNVNLLNLVKRMGIKGRKDLYMLRVEDFEVRDDEQATCHVICTKPSAGGTENLRSMHAIPTDGEKCPVYLFREFLRHRPKHMRGIGPLFLALSNFTTDADVWYRPVRLSEATLGSIIRQMANAARTMGLSGVQNLGNVLIGSQKMDQANRNILPNQQNQQQVMGQSNCYSVLTDSFEDTSYLSSADASILAQYYGDKGYPPTMVRSNKVETKSVLSDNILQNMATSLGQDTAQLASLANTLYNSNANIGGLAGSHNTLNALSANQNLNTVSALNAAVTSLANFQNSQMLGQVGGQRVLLGPMQTINTPVSICPEQRMLSPNVTFSTLDTSQSYPTVSTPSNPSPQSVTPQQTPPTPSSLKNLNTVTSSPSAEQQETVIQSCTINVVSGDVNGEGSVKEEKMDYSEFLSKCNQNVPLPPNSEGLQAGPYNNKVINAEIKDILELLKQGSAKFVNCTFNFHFHQ